MEWVQVYDPLGSPWLSTLLAAAPIVVLLGLAGRRTIGAAGGGRGPARGAGRGDRRVSACRLPAALASAVYGACFGLLPIGWIVLAAVFLFHLTVRCGPVRSRQAFGGRAFRPTGGCRRC